MNNLKGSIEWHKDNPLNNETLIIDALQSFPITGVSGGVIYNMVKSKKPSIMRDTVYSTIRRLIVKEVVIAYDNGGVNWYRLTSTT